MTLLVLLAANQVGNGYELIVPRMIDTLIGSVIASFAVFAVLPDWQGRRMHEAVARAIGANRDYLRALMSQYADGPRDDLPFRLARRNAHNADAALSAAVAGMLREPGFMQRQGDTSVRLLVLSHTLLSYLSGLGAHRERLAEGPAREAVMDEAQVIVAELGAVATRLAQGLWPGADEVAAVAVAGDATAAASTQAGAGVEFSGTPALVHTQLTLLARQLPMLRRLATGVAPTFK